MTLRPTVLLAAALATMSAALAQTAAAPDNYSEAERALFMTHHLAAVKPPVTLRYRFARSGSLEPAFDDKVSVALAAQPGGGCCAVRAEFLSGERRLTLPEVEGAQGNPVILYFLERDVREMSRLTKGQAAYFRKRIRMAVFQGATVSDATIAYAGKSVAAREISVTPYADDPLRARFEQLAGKQYVFTMSSAVPGGVAAIRSLVRDAKSGVAPIQREQLTLEGVELAP